MLIYNVGIAPAHQPCFMKCILPEHQDYSASWTIFVDLREYACPEEIFRKRVLAYVSVTQLPCHSLSNETREVFVGVDTRTFDRGFLVAQLTNSTHKTTSSIALLFDRTGEGLCR